MVILFTGHGTRAPGGTRTTLSHFAFESVPETRSPKTEIIDEEVLNFLDIAQKDGTSWVPKSRRDPGAVAAFTPSQATVDRLAPKWAALQAMRDAFSTNQIDRLILLTCNVGLFPDECQKLANLIRTTVVAYRALIATTEVTPPFDEPLNRSMRSVMIWSTTDHSSQRPPPDPLTNAMFMNSIPEATNKWILANWKHHPYWAMIPAGPGIECKPDAPRGTNF
jgi:hypothetical protein